MGDIGCTSFFPSKNLGCYGDGGALYTNNEQYAITIKKIANHGQAKKYIHELIGVNSRLDSIQAAILSVKLAHLDEYISARNRAACFYDDQFKDLVWVSVPERLPNSTHVFHQYTLILDENVDRDHLRNFLQEKGIPSMVYYPFPLHFQEAFKTPEYKAGDFPVTEKLCKTVLSLPMHTELSDEHLKYIVDTLKSFKI
jgi:UDP-2-acetamido-2-deoxy-ribo-hexuluronate aminotransferase